MKKVSSAILALALVPAGTSWAQAVAGGAAPTRSPRGLIATLLGGEARTIHLARTAYQERRFGDAVQLFEQAIVDVPRRRGELLREYADALNNAGRSGEAIPLYREMLARAPDETNRKDLSAQLGRAMIASRQYAPALDVYTALLARYPGDADIALRRAGVLSALGQADAAVAALNRVPPAAWARGAPGALGDGVLVAAAAAKARAGQTAAARQLYDRAFQHNGRLRAVHQRDYLALTAVARPVPAPVETPGDRAASYRQALAKSAPGSRSFLRLQEQYAQSLTAANMPQQSVEAWETYLRYAPADASAQIARAKLLERLGQTAKAKDGYADAYARDPGNAAARSGLLGATLSLARRAARDNRNDDAIALFAAAVELDQRQDRDILREYADQLSFSGQSVDAVPVYLEALANPDISALNRRRAMIGLADAYSWSDRLSDALPVYTELAAAAPEDTALQWAKLLCEARLAGRSNRNAEAIDRYAKAIAAAPDREPTILAEYADQLSFVGRSAEAISLYQRALEQPALTDNARLGIRMGLAQAYEWTGRHQDAETEYGDLLKANPQDIQVQWRLLVVSARDAAIHDRNADSARLFAKAIQVSPDSSKSILGEYADQLSFTGRSSWALTFYKAALEQPGLTELQRTNLFLGQARAFDWAGNYAGARDLYDVLLKKTPGDLGLQWHRLVASGRDAARGDQNAKAAALFADAIKLLPERRMDILKEYADKLTFSEQARQAIPLYRELLLQSNTQAKHRDYSMALAMALAWDAQLGAALDVYQRLASEDSSDLAARAGAGQMLSWMGRRDDARGEFQKVLLTDPANAAATRGLAQVEDWDGRHGAAQVLLRRRLQQDPNDMDARRMLAQSLVWSGRPDVAIGELELALNAKSELRFAQGGYVPRDNRLAASETSREFPK